MQNIETYNRVPALDSTARRRILLYGYILSVFVVILVFTGLLVKAIPLLYTLTTCLLVAISLIALHIIESKRAKRCHHCRSTLDSVTRPFILSTKNLASRGTKIGDHFFSYCRWGRRPLTKRWAKISRQSLACHHCRLTETRVVECYEHVSAAELDQIKSKMSD